MKLPSLSKCSVGQIMFSFCTPINSMAFLMGSPSFLLDELYEIRKLRINQGQGHPSRPKGIVDLGQEFELK